MNSVRSNCLSLKYQRFGRYWGLNIWVCVKDSITLTMSGFLKITWKSRVYLKIQWFPENPGFSWESRVYLKIPGLPNNPRFSWNSLVYLRNQGLPENPGFTWEFSVYLRIQGLPENPRVYLRIQGLLQGLLQESWVYLRI